MRRLLGKSLLAAVLFAAVLPAAPANADTRTSGYIVLLDNGVEATSVSADHGTSANHVYSSAVRGYSAKMTATAAARLARDPRVVLVQPDGVATTTAQTTPTGVDRVDAELSATARIDGADQRVAVDVAVIDTGVDLDHPDLNVHTAGAKNCSNGRTADDGNGHGTHVAGTIGALDNGDGVVGVAPGARIWPVRVLNNQGSGSWSDIICGIDYVTAHADEIEVANMSLGGSGSDSACGSNRDALHEAICRSVAAGVTYVVAAGNSAANSATFVPAAYDEVITVSALADFNGLPGGGAAATCRADVDDTFADFSNYGADVDLIAPGVCVLSTWKGGGYNTISGTSMASPHAAGGAALYKATHATASPGTVKSALQAAGTGTWNTATDPDATHEPLLNVASF
ncbi:subtilisin family serine protease [Saccharothrix ecbatanensis]|uniref:Subtilisin family serine protease n=1 Tax=Saccharothrix ecbatanensis TaxID=1105145 RepID=A0A7W9HEP6_9PSEU|nr:S8 family serine peptidase [Saccharothrix ecbatanensis]MBB5800902.1 subtilisin family serine protease [Saccharothrix ecbatanensis]